MFLIGFLRYKLSYYTAAGIDIHIYCIIRGNKNVQSERHYDFAESALRSAYFNFSGSPP